ECPDLYVDACVCDEQRNLIFLSAWGRDTVTQEFLARLTLGREENGIDHFHIIVDGRRLPVFPNQDLLEKRTTRPWSGKNALDFVNQYFSRPRGDSYVNG
ncbi:hypothetical protein AAIG97_34060, partial [Pseudomonas aeruginosa]